MNIRSLLFNIVARLIPLVLFWELVDILAERGLGFIVEVFTLKRMNVPELVQSLVFYTSSFLAILTVLTGSPLLYTTTLVLIAVSRSQSSTGISALSITGLIFLLVLDTLKTLYREEQNRSVSYNSPVKPILGVLVCALVILVYTLPGVLGGYVIASFVSSMNDLHGLPGLLAGNIFVKLTLVTMVLIYLFNVLSHITETTSIFVFPSRKIALETLSATSDIDVIYKAPLGFLKTLVITSFTAPLLYVAIVDFILPFFFYILGGVIPRSYVHIVNETWFRFLLALLVFIISWRLVSKILSFYEVTMVKGILIAVLILLITTYIVGIYYKYRITGDLISSLFNPDFGVFESRAQSIYYNYYVNFIYFFEVVSVLVGFAP